MRGLPLSLITALRFSRGRKRSGMVSFISVMSTLGITLGVAVLIIGLSAMNGFERELAQRVLAVVPHGEIESMQQPYRDWRQDSQRISEEPFVTSVAPYIDFTALIENGTKLKAIQVKGVDPKLEADNSALPTFVEGMPWSNFVSGEQQIVIGKGVADHLGVKVGDWITLMVPEHSKTEALKVSQPKRIRLQVSGVLNLVGDLGFSFALVPLKDAQAYLEYGESVTGLAVNVNDLFNANKLIYSAAVVLEKPVYAPSWMAKYGRMHRDIQLVRSIMYLVMVLVISVACFNIVSTLIMAVKDKSSDIAVLRTLGADDSDIRSIFLWYGLITGAIGALSGIVLGVITALNLTGIIQWLERIFDHQFLSGGVYFIDFLPSQLNAMDIVVVFITALILSLVASWYPAQRACKLNPARILSGQ